MTNFVVLGETKSRLTLSPRTMKHVNQIPKPEVPQGPKTPEVPQPPTTVPEVPELDAALVEEQIQKHNKAADHNDALAERHRAAAKALQVEDDGQENASAPQLHVLAPTYDPSDNQQHPAM